MKNKTMKKILGIILSFSLLLFLMACGSDESKESGSEGGSDSLKNIMFVVTGTLGGGTNNDDVYEAIEEYTNKVDGNVDTFEADMDTSLFESTLMEASESGEYDLIVTGFGTMIEPLENTASKYENQKYLIFDTEMDYSEGKNSNVVSVQVLQNEGGFLAGALAAEITQSDADLANDEKIVGFVGAMESTAIEDFLVGYIEGVNYVDPSIEVLYSFVGNHTDSALANELGLSQYQQGADVVFAVGNNGLGVAEAALSAEKYVIGVDFDYALRLEETNKENSEKVLTSVMKDYKGMVLPMLENIEDGTIDWGSHTFIPFAEGGVYLTKNDYTDAIVTDEVWENYNLIEDKLKEEEIDVSTAFGASTEELNDIKSEAAPQ